jgi:hypothetical protein
VMSPFLALRIPPQTHYGGHFAQIGLNRVVLK